MTRAQFAYFKKSSSDEIVRHIRDIIADSNLDENIDKSFLILCSDYSAAFYTVSREYIDNVLSLTLIYYTWI